MKQGDVIRAYKALQKLSAETLPIKIACKLHRLKTQLRTAWEFQLEEEGKLIDQLHPIAGEDGKLTFQSKEDSDLFRERLSELSQSEADDMTFDPVTVPMMDGISLSADDIEALEGFVMFSEA